MKLFLLASVLGFSTMSFADMAIEGVGVDVDLTNKFKKQEHDLEEQHVADFVKFFNQASQDKIINYYIVESKGMGMYIELASGAICQADLWTKIHMSDDQKTGIAKLNCPTLGGNAYLLGYIDGSTHLVVKD